MHTSESFDLLKAISTANWRGHQTSLTARLPKIMHKVHKVIEAICT